MVTMDNTLNGFPFHDHGSIFKVPEGYVSKLTLFMRYFLEFCVEDFQIKTLGKHSDDF